MLTAIHQYQLCGEGSFVCVHHILALRNGRYNSRAPPFSSTIVKPLKLVRNWKKYSYCFCTMTGTDMDVALEGSDTTHHPPTRPYSVVLIRKF